MRKQWRHYWERYEASDAECHSPESNPTRHKLPSFPVELVGLTCGATTRAGSACKLNALYANGRCKLHGGLSTGPKSEAGRERSRINGRKGGRPRQNPSP